MSSIEETLAQEFAKNPMAPAIPELSPRAEVALLARTLFHEGYDDHLSGHITSRQEDGTLLVNPFGLPWDEIKASDVMRIDLEGHTLEGKWTVTPAITLHIELHQRRHDVKFAVHNHPEWGTIWANARRIPPAYDQTSAQILDDDITTFDEFDGPVQDVANAAAAVTAMGEHHISMLANHGVFVVGKSAAQAHHRASTLEWRCRNAWRTEVLGGAVELKPDVAAAFGTMFQSRRAFPGLWEAAVRRELRLDPAVLD